MDYAAATYTLNDFRALIRRYETACDYAYRDDRPVRELNDELTRRLVLVRTIADKIMPGIKRSIRASTAKSVTMKSRWRMADTAVAQVVGWIEGRDEYYAIVHPGGPAAAGEGFHPWVWDAAGSLWSGGHYRAAVAKAAANVDRHLQSKLDRYDLSGSKLAGETFSEKPADQGAPRLVPVGYPETSESYRSARDGARFFAMGCMTGIRNLAAHETDEWDRQVALEQLAALSVLARWIDAATVVHTPVENITSDRGAG